MDVCASKRYILNVDNAAFCMAASLHLHSTRTTSDLVLKLAMNWFDLGMGSRCYQSLSFLEHTILCHYYIITVVMDLFLHKIIGDRNIN